MLSQVKLYAAIAGTVIIAVLVGIFKYRGVRIGELKDKVATMKKDHEYKNKVTEFEARNKAKKESMEEDRDEHEIIADVSDGAYKL